MERKALISEIKSSYNRRRAENWLIVVTVIIIMLGIAAGLDYSMGADMSLKYELIVWGGALLWIILFIIGHARVMSKLAENEKRVIENLQEGNRYKYVEKPEPAIARWLTTVISAIIGFGLLYYTLNTLFTEKIIGEYSLVLTAELTVIIFAAILALLCAFIRIFPIRQKYYTVKVSTFGDEPELIRYRIQRKSEK